MGSVSGEPGKGGGVWRVRAENKDIVRNRPPQEDISQGDSWRQEERSRARGDTRRNPNGW